MVERKNDTTELEESSQSERTPSSYYYDDSTGYERYDPQKDEEEGEEVSGQWPVVSPCLHNEYFAQTECLLTTDYWPLTTGH